MQEWGGAWGEMALITRQASQRLDTSEKVVNGWPPRSGEQGQPLAGGCWDLVRLLGGWQRTGPQIDRQPVVLSLLQ